MAEKKDWSKLSTKELLEMLQRQEKLVNKKFLQSLPDKGKKIIETVKRLKDLISQREKLELQDIDAQFEKLTVSQPVQKTRVDLLDSDDSDDSDDNDRMLSGSDHQDTANVNKQSSGSQHEEAMDSKSSSGRTWDYKSAATPATYKFEIAKPISLEESFKLQQEQEKRRKDLQAQQATMKLREQSYQVGTYHSTQVSNPLQYQETVLENHSSDDSDPEEYNARPFKMDSEDDGD